MPGVLAYIAPYGQTGYGRVRPTMGAHDTGTYDYTRDIVPGYFGFHYIHDSGGDPFKDRPSRINEVCWGEILVTDGWGRGLKQRSIREHYQHASDIMRRTTAFARRFGLIEHQGEELPLPYALRNARQIPAEGLALNASEHDQLRPHTASSPDRREAALMLGWYGWPYPGSVDLKGDLPGVDVRGRHRHAWDLETGKLLNTPDGRIHVPAAPVTMFRSLYVRGENSAPKAPPEGVNLAISFDQGTEPDLGGGLIEDPGRASLTGGASGRALRVGSGAEALSYGAVPSWFSGSVEFDLRVEQAGGPMPLLRMKRHMDTTLWLAERNGKPALKLETYERNAEPPGYQKSGFAPKTKEGRRERVPATPERRTAWVPLPQDRDWHRITLVWEVGQYRLYVDGQREAMLAKTAVLRWRDGSVLQPGLLIGGQGGGGRAAIDSLVLYDWAPSDSQVKGRTSKLGLSPLQRADQMQPSVYLWGTKPEETERVSVNFRRFHNGLRCMGVSASLYKVLDGGGRQKLAAGNARAYRGTASIVLEFEPEAPPVGSRNLDLKEQQDEFEGLDELMRDATKYVLEVTANAAGENPPKREITFVYGMDGKGEFYFE
jgi:hypothetical protein